MLRPMPDAIEPARDFEGRRALVTGAGAGIGRAIALRLARAGADVACADIDGETADSAAKEVEALGVRGLALSGDVAQEDDANRLVDETASQLGGLDVLVNNAGITLINTLEESPTEEWDRTHSVNLRGVFLLCRRAIPLLRASGRGAIVNIASMAALRFTVPHVPYAASKAGVLALTRDLAFELAPDRIRVNAVSPGPIKTQILGSLDDAQIAQAGLRFILGRIGLPEDIAEAVAFLASDRASYITGQNLPVTGGAELATRPMRPDDA